MVDERWRRAVLWGLLLVATGAWAPAASASEDMRRELAKVAKNVKIFLDSRQKDAIAVGEFTGPANFPTSAGPGMVYVLTEELQKNGIQVKTRAEVGLKGEYRLSEVPAENRDDARLGKKVLALHVEATLTDSFGAPLARFNLEGNLRSEAAVAEALGLTVSLDPGGVETERDRALREQIVDPAPHVQGPLVRSRENSPYGVEILVNDRAAEPTVDDGLAFASIARGDTYSIRLRNDSDLEAAVQLRIDGLSMFAFSQMRHKEGEQAGQPLYTVVIVPAKKSVVIQGWHITNEQTDKFLVTEYAQSAAATIQHAKNLGTITATFQAAWPEDAPAPADEPGKRRGGAGDATGFGPRIDVKYQEVARNLGVIRDCISVRYTK